MLIVAVVTLLALDIETLLAETSVGAEEFFVQLGALEVPPGLAAVVFPVLVIDVGVGLIAVEDDVGPAVLLFIVVLDPAGPGLVEAFETAGREAATVTLGLGFDFSVEISILGAVAKQLDVTTKTFPLSLLEELPVLFLSADVLVKVGDVETVLFFSKRAAPLPFSAPARTRDRLFLEFKTFTSAFFTCLSTSESGFILSLSELGFSASPPSHKAVSTTWSMMSFTFSVASLVSLTGVMSFSCSLSDFSCSDSLFSSTHFESSFSGAFSARLIVEVWGL